MTLRNLYCSPETGLWELSEGDEAKIIAVAHNGNPLKHLSWSHSGTELAVADILGNISVFTLAIAINHCTVSRRCALGTEDNLSAIVGLSWLNQDRSVSIVSQGALKLLADCSLSCHCTGQLSRLRTANGLSWVRGSSSQGLTILIWSGSKLERTRPLLSPSRGPGSFG